MDEIHLILERLNAIEKLQMLAAKNVLNMDEVSLLTGISKSYLYKLTCNKEIPYYKPNGKLVYFNRDEVEAWMLQNRECTTQEVESAANSYLAKKGGSK